MFDTHNAVAETTPHAELIRRYHPYVPDMREEMR
jgi:hypothetical protein